MREEFKYLVSNEKIELLRKLISPFVSRDDHIAVHGDPDYTVRSIYFDTINLKEYHKKLSGDLIRKKIRIRGYNHHPFNDLAFLEIKRKFNNGQLKSRAPIIYSHLEDLFIKPYNSEYIQQRTDFPKALKNANSFFYYIKRDNMVPVVSTIYEREAYIHKFDHNIRITFDKNLRGIPYPSLSSLYSDKGSLSVYSDDFILEIKSDNGFPVWMERIINILEIHRQALSKYTMCIDRSIGILNNFNREQIISKSNFYNYKE